MNFSISSIISEENKIYALLKRLFLGEKHLKREDNLDLIKFSNFYLVLKKVLLRNL
jgi:hypothetical protein